MLPEYPDLNEKKEELTGSLKLCPAQVLGANTQRFISGTFVCFENTKSNASREIGGGIRCFQALLSSRNKIGIKLYNTVKTEAIQDV